MIPRIWTFRVEGDPVPWARPRKRKHGGYYEKPEVTVWRRMVATYALQVKPPEPTKEAVELMTVFRLRRPGYLPKKVCYHTRKPDSTNLMKGVEDALIGLLYHDDAQVIRSIVQKDYVLDGEMPGVLIRVQEILP
jgi:Holliday junction resolvase RusA-like endonuclease